jgi:hypothetical protein
VLRAVEDAKGGGGGGIEGIAAPNNGNLNIAVASIVSKAVRSRREVKLNIWMNIILVIVLRKFSFLFKGCRRLEGSISQKILNTA